MNETPLSDVVDSILQMRCDTPLKRQMLLALKLHYSESEVLEELLAVISVLMNRVEASNFNALREHYHPEYLREQGLMKDGEGQS